METLMGTPGFFAVSLQKLLVSMVEGPEMKLERASCDDEALFFVFEVCACN
jgi:hypothetical protein